MDHNQSKYKMYQELVQSIPDRYAADYKSWSMIKQSIYNLYEGSDEGLEVYLEFSKRCPDKYNEQLYKMYWKSTKMDPRITIDTLIFYAGRMDDY